MNISSATRPMQLAVSVSSSELSKDTSAGNMSVTKDISTWNPFEDPTPFSQMTEDHIFGAEFDKIREGSQTSKFHDFFFLCLNLILSFLKVLQKL